MNISERITDAELKVMQIVWDAGGPVSYGEIREAIGGGPRRKTTVQTLIHRLVEKGALVQEKREVYMYTAAVSREEYEQAKTSELLDKVYRGDARKLVATLVKSRALPAGDAEELRRFWREVKGDE